MTEYTDLFMARSTDSKDEKREFSVQVHLTESEYEDVVCVARAMNLSKSQYFSRIHHVHTYGLLGERSSRIVDEDGRSGISPIVKTD